MSINTNELPADYWENSVETPGYPYRTYINMENFLALLKKASTCWKFYSGSAYYEGEKTQAALRTMADKLGPEAQKLYDEKFNNS